MNDRLRRLFNAVESAFDRRAIDRSQRFTRADTRGDGPASALSVASLCRRIAAEFDRGAALTLIAAPRDQLQPDGCSHRWDLFFDLPARRARLVATWSRAWDEEADDFRGAEIDLRVDPFPPEDHPVRQMVSDGQLLHRQLVGLWKKECAERPPLPRGFRDSTEVMADLNAEGLEVANEPFSLKAQVDRRLGPCWVAETRDRTVRVPLR